MYVISNGLAIHIKQNADKLKEFFSDQEEKYKIVVQRNDFKKGSANNDWFGVFDEFATTTGKTVLDKELIALMQQSFASTTRKSMTARNIAVMDSMSPYCDFELHTMCGIPNITLRGSTEEWNNVRKFANYLRKYGLDWWIDELDKVLEHFVIAHSGITNDNELQSWNDNELPFWNEMVKKSGGSGGPYYNGWISTFFPYSGGDSPKPRKDFTTRFTSGCVPSGISSVDIKWKYFSEEIPLKVHTGMMCCTINKQGSLRPKLLFCVENCGPESKIITVNGFKIGENDVDGFIITDKAKEAVVHGRYCNPAGLHYYNQNKHYLLRYNDPDVVFGADCDLCKAKSINVSIAYCNDYDLCLKCVDRIITFTKSKEPTKIKTWNPYQ